MYDDTPEQQHAALQPRIRSATIARHVDERRHGCEERISIG